MSSTYKPLKISHLSFGYDKNKPILNDINLTIPRGGFSLITGPTGCGKSTLLRLIAGLNLQGKIIGGQIENVPCKWSMVFQNSDRQFTMATAYQELVFTLENLQISRARALKTIKEVATVTNISDLLHKKIVNLSGGEKQRIAFAVALAMKPDLLLLDEAFASCDQRNREFLQKQLLTFKNYGCTIIAVDHNLDGYQDMCDQVYLFKNKTLALADETETRTLFSPKSKMELAFKIPAKENLVFASRNLSYVQEKTLVAKSNFYLPQNSSVLLTGENGAGKSSLFKVLTKLLAYNGSLSYQNKEVKKLKAKKYLRNVSQVFQNYYDKFLM